MRGARQSFQRPQRVLATEPAIFVTDFPGTRFPTGPCQPTAPAQPPMAGSRTSTAAQGPLGTAGVLSCPAECPDSPLSKLYEAHMLGYFPCRSWSPPCPDRPWPWSRRGARGTSSVAPGCTTSVTQKEADLQGQGPHTAPGELRWLRSPQTPP